MCIKAALFVRLQWRSKKYITNLQISENKFQIDDFSSTPKMCNVFCDFERCASDDVCYHSAMYYPIYKFVAAIFPQKISTLLSLFFTGVPEP